MRKNANPSDILDLPQTSFRSRYYMENITVPSDSDNNTIDNLFGGVLTVDQIRSFKESLQYTGNTAEGLEKFFDDLVKISEADAGTSADLSRKWELAASDYIKRMQGLDHIPSAAISMAKQAEANFTAAREAMAAADKAKAAATFAKGVGGMMAPSITPMAATTASSSMTVLRSMTWRSRATATT